VEARRSKQRADTRVFCYTNTELWKDQQNEEILRFVRFWKERTGQQPQELIFGSNLTTYAKLHELNRLGIQFITLCRRSKGLMQKLHYGLGARQTVGRRRMMARKKQGKLTKPTRLPADYAEFLESLKVRVRQAQTQAILSVNREVISLYWEIGREIVERQEQANWGQHVLERLADDLQKALPGVGGFSRSNVFRMRAFYLAYRTMGIVAQPVRQLKRPNVAQAVRQTAEAAPPKPVALLPWGHNVVLIQKVKGAEQRLWYASKALEHGWSRAVLTVQIETDLFGRQGKAVTNFSTRLPPPQSDLAQESFKDPYLFDFLTMHEEAVERDLETGLVEHIQRFLLELGAGFAFVGRQVRIVVGDDDFYLDLLFYHLRLRCFVVIDLKMKRFTPEDAGKMNFYLSAVDSQMKHGSDAPTIGLILCKTRDRITAEYALRDITKPIGVAEWQTKLVHSLPDTLRGSLPSIEEIEAELGSEVS
jgi:predicted nuclease of restriction endonuclease-like (RecB) superfamily